jgi:hypothetical protein
MIRTKERDVEMWRAMTSTLEIISQIMLENKHGFRSTVFTVNRGDLSILGSLDSEYEMSLNRTQQERRHSVKHLSVKIVYPWRRARSLETKGI